MRIFSQSFFSPPSNPKDAQGERELQQERRKDRFPISVRPSLLLFFYGYNRTGCLGRRDERESEKKKGKRKEGGRGQAPSYAVYSRGALREDHPHWIGLSSRGRSAFRPFESSPSGRCRNISSNKLGVMRDPNASSYAEIGREDLLGVCRIFGGRRTEGVY